MSTSKTTASGARLSLWSVLRSGPTAGGGASFLKVKLSQDASAHTKNAKINLATDENLNIMNGAVSVSDVIKS